MQVMNTGYCNQHSQQQTSSAGPEWTLICIVFVLALGLIALPWIILGVIVERVLSRQLQEKQRLLLWIILFFLSAFFIYQRYQHGLQPLIIHEFITYIAAAKHYQTDFTHWPFHALWAATFPVWLQTWQGLGIVGLGAELLIHPHKDTTQTLRQNEKKRQQAIQRSQRRARRRSIRPGYVPDAVGDLMVIGIPIQDTLEGE
jgi:hypothetical protein